MVGHRKTLVAALIACACGERLRMRRFLLGLSGDELQFIAAFLGACILECSEDLSRVTRAVQAHQVKNAPGAQSDRENKMILLREFLNLSGREPSNSIAN